MAALQDPHHMQKGSRSLKVKTTWSDSKYDR